MLKFKDISYGKKFLYIFLIDIAIFLASFHSIINYKFFSILITSILTGYLTFLISCYFIQFLKSYDANSHELDLYQFLFKNEQIYQIIAKSVKKIYIKQMKKDIEKDSCILSTNQILGKLDFEINQRLMKGIEKFIISLSEYCIEPWYFSYISTNDNFKNEAKLHLESILKDLFNRLNQMNKMNVFSKIIFILNENFLNHALNYNLKNQKIIKKLLHPAVRNLPESEINYIKKIVQIIIRKSSQNLEIKNEFFEEFFMQIIGKNCLENLVNHLVKPQFLYYALCLLLDKEKTQQFIKEYKNFSEKDSTKPEKEVESNTNVSCMNRLLFCNVFIDSEDIQIDRLKKSTSQKSLSIKESPINNPVNILTSRYLEIVNIEVIGSDTSKEPKTGKEFTLYIIQVIFFNLSHVLFIPSLLLDLTIHFKNLMCKNQNRFT
ncbi:unnamed protein product [Brachionus calyciflorus]|uniref:PXA domain-containing protein n=1 Tax=Brachionus calyciflorus TaxID=104777 RepID=A0A814H1P2_9BILA|nr:unnamed protein product [Brachionus calyciflorus]